MLRHVLEDVLQRRVVFVSGKGGVGKTTITAALARAVAARGKTALVTEIAVPGEEHSPLAELFGLHRLPREVAELSPGVHGAILLAQAGQELFAARTLRSDRLVRRIFSSEALLKFLAFAPSCRELGIYYHLFSLAERRGPEGRPMYDVIVVDMPATGHALALTSLPGLLLKLFKRGPIHRAIRDGQSYFNSPELTRAFVVSLPETLPASEALELVAGLQQSNVAVGGVIVNRVTESPFSRDELRLLQSALHGKKLLGGESLQRIADARQAIERIRAAGSLPVTLVPDCLAGQVVQRVAEALAGGSRPLRQVG